MSCSFPAQHRRGPHLVHAAGALAFCLCIGSAQGAFRGEFISRYMSQGQGRGEMCGPADSLSAVDQRQARGRIACIVCIADWPKVRMHVRQVTQKGLGSGGGDGTRGAGKDGVLDVLVMENIFYGHATSRIYDLKARATC